MQGKGLIKYLLIAIGIACAIQLYYYIPTSRVEGEAVSYAKQRASLVEEASKEVEYKRAYASYLDSLSTETIMDVPLLGKKTYNELKKSQLALGLDLKGGMSSVLQVDLKEMLVSLAGRKATDPDFTEALAKATKAQETSEDEFVSLFVNAFKEVAPNRQLSSIFAGNGVLSDVTINTSNDEVTRRLEESAKETVRLTYQTLKERIDKLGVTQPNVSLDEARQLILVEMPGIDNPKRARQFLNSSAQLDFWHTYKFSDKDFRGLLIEADQKLASVYGQEKETRTKWHYKFDENGNAVDSTATVEEVATLGPLLSKLDIRYGGGPYFGIADKNQRDDILNLLSHEAVKNSFPRNAQFMWGYKPMDDNHKYHLYLIKKRAGSNKAPIEGDVITGASQGLDQNNSQPVVNISMNSEGAKKWSRMTKEASLRKGQIAISLDNQVVSAPNVSNAITGGRTQISGNFTIQEAIDFAKILEVGKLPAKTKIIQESTVGPSLGAANINASKTSLLIGFGLVLAFMVFYYGGSGIVSIIALLTNVFFIFGALSQIGTVLTLPGIAGIVLTIGMAVDANVIIFERIREELREGKSLKKSVLDGFNFSYSAIIDANVTTLLVGAVLAFFGLGPIKGFAVVLIVGVISSLLTAVLLGSLIITGWVEKDRNLSFSTGVSKNLFSDLNIDWISKRKLAYIVSSVLIVISLGSIFTKGFDYGIDFSGGHSYNIQFAEGVDKEALNTQLDEVFGSSTLIKQVDTDNTYNVTTQYLIKDKSDGADAKVVAKLLEGVNTVTGKSVSLDDFLAADGDSVIKVTSAAKVGPTIADDIKSSSWKAGGLALLLIFVYILIRFARKEFSIGAIAALVHDSIIVCGIFSLTSGWWPFTLEVDQAFIAALLTIIGYSINDTVVVFDRIREYFGIYQENTKDEIFNMAINSTVSRTIITSLTTLIVVLILLLFGGASIKGFAFALVVGIIVGTYSSIFVATPIVRELSGDLKAAFKEKEIEVEPEVIYEEPSFDEDDQLPTIEA